MNSKYIRKNLLGVFVCLSMALLFGRTANAATQEVNYYDPEDGTTKSQTCTVLEGSDTTDDVTLEAGWYVANGAVTYKGQLVVSGGATIVLSDGSSLVVEQSIKLESGDLTIYGQEGQTGSLTIPGQTTKYRSGINVPSGSTLTINGGVISVTGDWNSGDAIANGSYSARGGNLIQNAGNVTLTGGNSGAVNMNSFVLNGGTCFATTGHTTNAVRTATTVNGGRLVASNTNASTTSTDIYAFTSQPTIKDGYIVKAGADEASAAIIPRVNVTTTTFTQSRYVAIEKCESHENAGGYCKNCGKTLFSTFALTIAEDPAAGKTLKTTASVVANGVNLARAAVVWRDSAGEVESIARANQTYTATATVDIGTTAELVDNEDAITATINDKEATINVLDGRRLRVSLTFAATGKYDTELEFDTYKTSYSMIDEDVAFLARKGLTTTEVMAADVEGLEDAEVTYTSDNPNVAMIDETSGLVTFLKTGEFHVTATLADGVDYKGSTVTSDLIKVTVADISDLVEVTMVATSDHAEYGQYIYNGNTWEPKFTVVLGDKTLEAGVDYTVSTPADMVNVGEKEIKLLFKGNYKGSYTETGYITPFDITDLVDVSFKGESEYAYTGEAWFPKFDVYFEGILLKEGTDYEIYYPEDMTNPGSHSIMVSMTGNYSGDIPMEAIIYAKDISDVVEIEIVGGASVVYTGTPWKPQFNVNVGSISLAEGKDYTVTYPEDMTHIGNKVFSFKFIGNYTGGKEITGSIAKKDISSLVDISFVNGDTYEFNGEKWEPQFSVKLDSKELVADTDYILSYPEDMVRPGEKEFVFEFIGVYAGKKVVTGTISEKKPEFVMPEVPYVIDGQKGKNDYYKSVVNLIPAEGYYISTSSGEGFRTSLSLEDSFDKLTVYLQDATTGLVSEAIPVDGMKIDPKAPEVDTVYDGVIIYGEEIEVTVTDKHLESVTLNGEACSVENNKVVLKPSSNHGEEEYELEATDIAGNVTKLHFFVSEEWVKSGVIPSAQLVHLIQHKLYHLSDGSWTVMGDSTVYNGNHAFYVKDDNVYMFQQN